jgi:thiol-disulfide isomerase/thioredoxin
VREIRQSFFTLRFVKMTPEFWTALIVVLIVSIAVIVLFRSTKGFYPASRLIVEDPPIEHNGLEAGQARFMMFYTTWCPYCKKADPKWKSFKQQLKNNPKEYNGYKVTLEAINAEVDKGKSALYKINAYPSFRLETVDKVITFEGVPDPLNFEAFLNAALA